MTPSLSRASRFVGASLLALTACADSPLPVEPSVQFNQAADRAGFEPFHVAFSDDQLCAAHGGFDVWTELNGSIKVASAAARRDGGLRIVEIITNGTIALTANGRTLASRMSGTAIYEIDGNGDLDTITFVGLNGVFPMKGGNVTIETGRLVLDADGNVLIERGPHHVFGTNPDVARLCEVLAG